MKTVKEWLEQLDEPYRSQALKNMHDQTRVDKPLASEKKVKLMSQAVSCAFIWSRSPEGVSYWFNIYALCKNENIKRMAEQLDEPYRSQALKNIFVQTKVDGLPVLEERVSSLYNAVNLISAFNCTYINTIHTPCENENS